MSTKTTTSPASLKQCFGPDEHPSRRPGSLAQRHVKSMPQRLRRRVRNVIRSALGDLRLLPFCLPRRFHAYCCGHHKTGTHSINAIFSNYRSAHEADLQRTVRLAIAHMDGVMSDQEIDRFLLRRDRQLWLEMDSSAINGSLVKPLVRISPQAKFILTIRDVYGWVDSCINQAINYDPYKTPLGLLHRRSMHMQLDLFSYTPQDGPLESLGMHSLASFFHLWSEHNRAVLDSVPKDRLLIVKTSDIETEIPAIAAFVGVPAETLVAASERRYVSPKKHGVLAQLDSGYVRETAEQYCGELMQQFFPDVAPYDEG